MNKALMHHCQPKPEFGHEIGCVLSLPFRYLDGEKFMDRSVYGHRCTNYGSKWQLDGRLFDGVDDYVECGAGTPYLIEFTTEAWVKPKNITAIEHIIIARALSETNRNFHVWVLSNKHPYVEITQGGTVYTRTFTTLTLENDIAYHLVFTLKSPTWTMYLNGVAETYTQTITPDQSSGSLTCIGKRAHLAARFWDGLIDEVRIYNRALTQAEITDLYNNYGYTTTAYAGRVLVRKYCSPEPTWGTWGTEECFPHSTGFTIG